MRMPLVVITDCDHGSIAPEEAVLEKAGVEVRLGQARTEEDVMAVGRDADGLIVQYAPITERVLCALPRCRVVARYGVGVDTVDLRAATARGVVVANVPDYCAEEVSDHALALLLALWRRVALYDRAIHAGCWDFSVGKPISRLAGKVLGLVGVGRIGSRLARKAAGVGLTVWGHDPYLPTWPAGVVQASLEDLLSGADIVSLHLPLTEATRHLIGEAALRRMKPNALLINTSRGGLVDTAALRRALLEGRISGAGLDVLDREPPSPDSPLLALPNVVLTPHAAFYSEESVADLKRAVAEAVAAALRGERPASVVNPEVYARASKE